MKKAERTRVIIMGAGGRDFHNFNVRFRDDQSFDVAAFTATQIPFIADRVYPPQLSGPLYPKGIPIHPEKELPELVKKHKAGLVVFAYSDVSHEDVMHKASRALALGADFMLLGPDSTMLKSKKPVISVCAVRTGSGKSPLTRKLMGILRELGVRAVAIRHPMAYCSLAEHRVQRFGSASDVDRGSCTIEEREEYELLVDEGFTVFAGVDYKEVLKMAEREADVIVWDGGNNDFPFIRPDLEIVVADALRPRHTVAYYPGETNVRRADVVVINKASPSSMEGVREIRFIVKRINPGARVIVSESPVEIKPLPPVKFTSLKGKRVLVVEDGPTLTHGGMPFGAGYVAAADSGARIVSPVPYVRGSLKSVFGKYMHVRDVLPAMGYSKAQLKDLERTINAVPADAVILATPVNLPRLIKIDKPAFRVTYSIRERGALTLRKLVREFLQGHGP
jgi:predicted GTPase